MKKSAIIYFCLIAFLIIGCTDDLTNSSTTDCTIDKGLDIHRVLSEFTNYNYKSLNEGNVMFCNPNGTEKQFSISKSEGKRFWGISFSDSIDNCEYKYTSQLDYHEVNYSNLNETQNIYITYRTSGYSLLNDNVDSLRALYDLISFSSGNASSVGAFMINREEGQIDEEENPYMYYLKDLLKVDTTLNGTLYDSIYVLPNDFHGNLILYSTHQGIVQFEHDNQTWNLCQ